MKKGQRIIEIMVLFVLVSFSCQVVSEANQVGFSVEPVLPSNQLDKESGYFHIQLKPGNTQPLSVEVKNQTDKEITLKTSIASATTNVNGVVDYSPTKNKIDDSLPIDLSKQITIDKGITLSPHEKKIVMITVKMPKEEIEGVIASGITFEEDNQPLTKKVSSKTNVTNKFSYVLALLMQQNRELEVQPEVTLGDVQATEINTKTSISGFIRNVAPAYLNDVTIATTLTKKGDKQSFYDYKKEHMQFAPNSVFEFPTFLNGKQLEEGTYTYKAVISGRTNELNKEEQQTLRWVLTDTITIDKKQAKELNQLDDLVDSSQETWHKWLFLAIGLNIVLIIGIIFYIVMKKMRH